MTVWLALAALALAQDASAQAAASAAPLRELSTDRPDKTEAPQTVDAGRIQIEFDLTTWTRDRAGGVRTTEVAVLPFNLKYGIDRATDVQLVVAPYLRRTVTDPATGTRDRLSGFGDMTLRVKRNLWGNDGGRTAFAAMPFVTLPTARGELGSGRVEAGLILPLSVGVADGVDVGAMTELDLIEQADGSGYVASVINSATVAFALTDRLSLYTELYTERAAERDSGWVVTGDTGLTLAIGENLQLDGGVNLGLTRAADDLNLFVGVSRRF